MAFGFRRGVFLAVLVALSTPSVFSQEQQDDRDDDLVPVAPAKRQGLFVREPEAPLDLFDAVVIAVDLGQPDVARGYLQQLLDAEPDRETLFNLSRQRGPTALLRLTKVRELEPLADTLMQRVNSAAAAYARDPQRLQELIGLLGASRTERAWAIVELRSAGSAAVAPLLNVLDTRARAEEHPGVLAALRHLDRGATPAMLAALDSGSVWLKTQIVQLFAQRGDREAAPFLWSLVASEDTDTTLRNATRDALLQLTGKRAPNVNVVAALLVEANRYDRREVSMTPDLEGLVEHWRWDAAENGLAVDRVTPAQVSRVLASRFAREALELAPEDPEAQAVFLTTALARDIHAAGDGPLPQGPGTAFNLALSAGPELPAEVLRRALSQGRDRLALAATQIVGQVGGEQMLFPEDGRTPVLLQALRHPNRRVQFAAAEAILGMRPQRPFAGSADVIAVLARAIRSRGEEKALVADSKLERARRLAGFAYQLGFDTDVAVTGKDAFRKAAASADYEMILLDLNILGWQLSETLANLKNDARTAGIPVYLVGPLEWSPTAERYAKRYRHVRYVVRPSAMEDLMVQLEPEAGDEQSLPLSAEERMFYAQRSIAWLYGIASGQVHVGDVRQAEGAIEDALSQPELAAGAVSVLGLLPTRSSQRSLVQVTLDDRKPVELRRSATDGLCYSIRKHGALLEPSHVSALAQLYESVGDAQLHAGLAAALGCLGHRPRGTGSRLRLYRARPSPAGGTPIQTPGSDAPLQSQPSEQP